MAQYGKNKQITDSNYDKSVAVKCVNGTFVGKKTENIIVYRGIPFVDQQPIGEWRWKAPMEYTADDGVYEAYHWVKTLCSGFVNQRPSGRRLPIPEHLED